MNPSATRTAFTLTALALLFAGLSFWLWREASSLLGRQQLVEQLVSGASLLLFAAAAQSALRWWRIKDPLPLLSRQSANVYFVILVAAVTLIGFCLNLFDKQNRPALGAFCFALAAALLLFGFGLVPTAVVGREALLDFAGRSLKFSKLQWFRLNAIEGAAKRHAFELGGEESELEMRLAQAPEKELSRRLQGSGLQRR